MTHEPARSPKTGMLPIVLLLTGFVAFAGFGDGFVFYSLHQSQQQYIAAQHTAQRQGALIEDRICATMAKLAALKPPAGNRKTNPSRAYEQDLHATLSQLGGDLGCGKQ